MNPILPAGMIPVLRIPHPSGSFRETDGDRIRSVVSGIPIPDPRLIILRVVPGTLWNEGMGTIAGTGQQAGAGFSSDACRRGRSILSSREYWKTG